MEKIFKFNELVYKLRKAKRLTQKELAEKLHTTAKTISNWERKKNCIPAEMISSIIKELDIDKKFIYEEYIDEGSSKNGVKFFYCPKCRNIMWSFTKNTQTCCNHTLYPLKASPENSEHYLYTVISPHTGFLNVSSNHPQNAEHRIEFMAYVSEENVIIISQRENKPFSTSFNHMPGGILYMFCSKHGLFSDSVF